MSITDYVRSELLILAPVLYLIGMALKSSKVKDNYIPSILGAIGIVLSTLWVFATGEFETAQDIATGAFTAITQGILVAGASVYVNQLSKQVTKDE